MRRARLPKAAKHPLPACFEKRPHSSRRAIPSRVFFPQLHTFSLNSTLVPIFFLLHSPPPTLLTSFSYLQPPRLPEHVPASLSQDVQRLRELRLVATTAGLRQGMERCPGTEDPSTRPAAQTLLRQQRRLIGRCAAGITYCATEPRWSPLRPRMQSWHRGGRVEQKGYSASRVARY